MWTLQYSAAGAAGLAKGYRGGSSLQLTYDLIKFKDFTPDQVLGFEKLVIVIFSS
jgi:hypothetical protein